MRDEAPPGGGQIGAAEVIAALCLATDLGMGLPCEHGLHSTLVAMRLSERLGVGTKTATQTYFQTGLSGPVPHRSRHAAAEGDVVGG